MVLFKLKRCRARLEAATVLTDGNTDTLRLSKIKEHRIPLILEDLSRKDGKIPDTGNDIVVWVEGNI